MNLRTSHWIGVIAILVLGGVVHGMWIHRWADHTATHAGVDYLAKIAAPLGDWQAGAVVMVPENEIPKGTTVACREFVHAKSHKRVVVSMTSGVPGVVAAHTPDVCFLGVGYKLKSPPSKQTLPMPGGGSVSF